MEDKPLDLSYKNKTEIRVNEESVVTGQNEIKEIKTAITVTKQVKSVRNLLPCEICNKHFDRPSLLKRHLRTHTGKVHDQFTYEKRSCF